MQLSIYTEITALRNDLTMWALGRSGAQLTLTDLAAKILKLDELLQQAIPD